MVSGGNVCRKRVGMNLLKLVSLFFCREVATGKRGLASGLQRSFRRFFFFCFGAGFSVEFRLTGRWIDLKWILDTAFGASGVNSIIVRCFW
jgi:hypothetical protein